MPLSGRCAPHQPLFRLLVCRPPSAASPNSACLADKRALVTRLEAEWVAAAEREVARHLASHVRIDDRGTWDGPTYVRYMAKAERVESS